MKKITFICTGGTIDKDYPKTLNGYNFEISIPSVHRVLELSKAQFPFEIVSIFKKDSLDITQEDLKVLCDACIKTDSERIVITHGTSTMLRSAKELSSIPQLERKTIVITGAFKPERFIESDASFNVGMAVSAVQCLNQGIYIALNGGIFEWSKCEQNETGFYVTCKN